MKGTKCKSNKLVSNHQLCTNYNVTWCRQIWLLHTFPGFLANFFFLWNSCLQSCLVLIKNCQITKQ